MAPAPELLVTGLLHTLDPTRPRAEAALLRDGKIASVGTARACAERAGEGVRRLEVASAVPGLVDAHGHVFWFGRARFEVSCDGAPSAEACAARVRERARTTPAGTWIRGRGWDQNRWPDGAFPSGETLTRAAPAHPVFLVRVDGHAAWVNDEALARAGLRAETPDPPGGRILRLENGRPSGVLVDTAMELVLSRIPAPSPREIEEALLAGLEELSSVGLTGAHDAGVPPDVLDVYRRLAAEDRLPLRVYAMLAGEPPAAELERRMEDWKGRREVGLLTVRAVKLFVDGALGSRGAAMFDEYADDPGNRGLFLTPPEVLREKARVILGKGFQPAIHAIGDRAIAETLDALEGADAEALRRARPRIEHLQTLRLSDAPRLARGGIVASMQPSHATSDGPWVPARLGAGTERLRGAYACRTVLRHGVPLAFGSDFPIESPDPRLGLVAAEARRPAGASAPFLPGERVTRGEALEAFTRGAAYASFVDDRRGMIREGFDADLTLFGADVMSVPVEALGTIPVTHTIVAGRVVFSR